MEVREKERQFLTNSFLAGGRLYLSEVGFLRRQIKNYTTEYLLSLYGYFLLPV